MYRLNSIPAKISASYFRAIDKFILKFIRKVKILSIDNTILKEKNKVGGLTLPDCKTFYRGTLIKTLW